MLNRVSLKAKLGMEDLERLIKDVRQMVEFSHSQQTFPNATPDAPALSTRRIRCAFFIFSLLWQTMYLLDLAFIKFPLFPDPR